MGPSFFQLSVVVVVAAAAALALRSSNETRRSPPRPPRRRPPLLNATTAVRNATTLGKSSATLTLPPAKAASNWTLVVPPPTSAAPTAAVTCPLQRVSRKALTSCLLANGQCVSSASECAELGGRYEASGCDGDDVALRCACCVDLPTESPSSQPSASPAPTASYPRDSCRVDLVPRAGLLACLTRDDGVCVSNDDECQGMGGTSFRLDGCDRAAHCGCCTGVPTDPPVGADYEAGPLFSSSPDLDSLTATAPLTTPAPTVERHFVLHRRSHDMATAAAPHVMATAIPTVERREREDEEKVEESAATVGRRAALIVVRLLSALVIAAIAVHLCPMPSHPVLRAILLPLEWVFAILHSLLCFAASCCFTFGDGIAEPRPPAPLKAMPIQTAIQMSDRRRHSGHSSSSKDTSASTGLLDDDDDDDDEYTDDDDDDDELSDDDDEAPNPFKKRS